MAKKFNKYEVIIEKGEEVSKVYTVAASKKDLTAQIEKDGAEVIRAKEVSNYLPSASRVRDDLAHAGYGAAECAIIYNLLLTMEGTEA